MRISTNTQNNFNVAALNFQQAQLAKTQQQAASGTRLLTAADDPAAYARVMQLTQNESINTQQAVNRNYAMDPLNLSANVMQNATTLLQNIRTNAVAAGSGSLSNSDRTMIGDALSGQLQQLISLANSTDGSGNYLFSGFQTQTPPFATAPNGVVIYNGDDGQRMAQVAAGRQMPVTDNGADVFMRIKNGNGTFVTQAAAGNTGSGLIDIGSVSNPAALTGNTYSISFPTPTTYAITPPPVTGNATGAFAPGVNQSIAFDGMQVSINGAPIANDSFTVAPSANQSVFSTISNLITTLKTQQTSLSLSQSLASGIANIDHALSNFSVTQSSQGLRLNELDALQVSGGDLDVQIKQDLSLLKDTNYNTALTTLNMQQTILQVAQKSFAQVANLSMFTYM